VNKYLSEQEVRDHSRASIQRMKDSGIKMIAVLGCGNALLECEASRALRNQKLEIEFAPELPLPGCDKKHCRCLIIAVSVLVMLAVLCGCTDREAQQATEARIGNLEARISELNVKLRAYGDLDDKIKDITASLSQSNTNFEAMSDLILLNVGKQAELRSLVLNLTASLTNSPTWKQSKFIESTANSQMIPSGVYQQIVSKAKAKWPSDYDMQVWEIKNQSQAYMQIPR
jgi:hypothetical protein